VGVGVTIGALSASPERVAEAWAAADDAWRRARAADDVLRAAAGPVLETATRAWADYLHKLEAARELGPRPAPDS
jgi:hypothetical protein